jgi:hypothetical protein
MQRAWLVAVGCAACAGSEARREPPVVPPVEAALLDEPAPPAPAETLDLAFAGDVMFGRFVEGGFRAIEAERHDLFGQVAHLLASDFTMVNLETPVVRAPPRKSPWGTRMRFVTTPARVATLRRAGVHAVTLANNHAFDMHGAGLAETPVILEELGIRHVGANRAEPPLLRAETFEIAGWRVAYVAATTERNWMEGRAGVHVPHAERRQLQEALVPVIAAARPDHDLVIAVLHWGSEYKDAPDRWQVRAARAFIDAGADAVVAHHPHVLQGIERYRDGVIAYSLGNFVFDNLHGLKRLHGILHLVFRRAGSRRCLDHAVFHPTVGTRPHYAPRPAGKELGKVADRLRTLSRQRPLTPTTWRLEGERLVVDGACGLVEQ